jgi:hypothetical protein
LQGSFAIIQKELSEGDFSRATQGFQAKTRIVTPTEEEGYRQ